MFCLLWLINVHCHLIHCIASLLCFVNDHWCPFTMFCWCSFSVLCWCLSMSPCYATLMFSGAPLLCFIDVHWCAFVMFCQCLSTPPCCVGPCPFVVFYWYFSTPPCCVLLVFINAPLPCVVGHLQLLMFY